MPLTIKRLRCRHCKCFIASMIPSIAANAAHRPWHLPGDREGLFPGQKSEVVNSRICPQPVTGKNGKRPLNAELSGAALLTASA